MLQGPHRQLLGYKSMNSLVIIQSVEGSEVYSLILVWEVGVTSFYYIIDEVPSWVLMDGEELSNSNFCSHGVDFGRPDRTCKPRRLVMFRGHVFEECRGLIAEAEAF